MAAQVIPVEPFDLLGPSRRGDDPGALLRQEPDDAGADAGACTGHEAGPAFELVIHGA